MAMSLKLFAGNSNLALAREVAEALGVPMGRAAVKRFSDGEIQVEIDDNVRGVDIFLLQSTWSATRCSSQGRCSSKRRKHQEA